MSNINSKFVKQSKKRLTAAKKVFLIVIVLIIATVVIVSSILLARKFAIKSARQSDSKRAQQLVYGSNIVVEISSSAQFPSCSGLEPFYPSVEKIYTNPNGRQFDISVDYHSCKLVIKQSNVDYDQYRAQIKNDINSYVEDNLLGEWCKATLYDPYFSGEIRCSDVDK